VCESEGKSGGSFDMPWSGLVAATEFAPGGRYREPPRRAPQERPAKRSPQEPPQAPEEPFDPDYYAGRFKADLTQLQSFEGARDAAIPANAEGDQRLFDFFGNLNVLLLAVRAGDLSRAQAAADALEMEVLVERSAGRRPGSAAHVFEGLGAASPRVETEGNTSDPPAAAYAPEASLDDGGVAYETLTQYLEGDAG